MKVYDFILMYEHKVRELENLCLLKYLLEERGYSVLIKCIHDLDVYRTSNRSCKPKYCAKVLGIFAFHTNDTIQYNVQNCIYPEKIVNLQWEQMISPNQEKSGSYSNPSGIGLEICHISWCQNNYSRLVDIAHVPSKNVFLCGNIGLDFLNPKLEKYFYSREQILGKYNLKKYDKICILFSNFMCAEQFFSNPEELRKRFGDSYIEAQENALRSSEVIIDWFINAARHFPNYAFIYRPHPGDNLTEVEDKISCEPNIIINRDFSSKQWIFVSDYMFSTHSTVVVEAHIAQKKCFVLEPYPVISEHDNEIFSTINPIDTQEKMFEILKGKEMDTGIQRTLVEKHFGPINENLNGENLANALISILNNPQYDITSKLDEYHIFKQNISSLKQKMRNNAIINAILLPIVIFGSYIPYLGKNISLFKQYNVQKKTMKVECYTKHEISRIEQKIRNVFKQNRVGGGD